VKFAKKAKKAVVGEEYETQKRKEVLSALKRDKRPLDKKTKEKIASDIVKKKGDTSKSDDRYAYEEVVLEKVKGQDTEMRKMAAQDRAAGIDKRLSPKEGRRSVKPIASYSRKYSKEEVVLEKDLNAAERRALPDKEFALPGKGKGPEGKQAGSYPIPDKSHARMALAMVAKHGTPEKKAQVRAAVAKKFPGIQQEAKKNPNNLVEPSDGVDSAKEVNKATRKAAFRPFNKEDKAFDTVVGMLRKKHGEGSVITKDSPAPKATEKQKKEYAAHKAKIAAQDTRDDLEKSSQGRYSRKYSNAGSD
jgi:hypothetical protein